MFRVRAEVIDQGIRSAAWVQFQRATIDQTLSVLNTEIPLSRSILPRHLLDFPTGTRQIHSGEVLASSQVLATEAASAHPPGLLQPESQRAIPVKPTVHALQSTPPRFTTPKTPSPEHLTLATDLHPSQPCAAPGPTNLRMTPTPSQHPIVRQYSRHASYPRIRLPMTRTDGQPRTMTAIES
jgi:hypothetical protein